MQISSALAVLLSTSMALMGASVPSVAQDVQNAQSIEQALRPTPRTRSIGATTPDVVNRLKRQTRGITIEDRVELAAAVTAGAVSTIDLEVLFAYNSSELTPSAVTQLVQLGTALSSSTLTGSKFVIAGHTDAAGGRDYNQQLSERRATSVRRFLVTNYRISEADLIVVGYGQEQLKTPNDPLSGLNRRVQVLNLGR